MAFTLGDIQYKLSLLDEITLMELLEVTSEDLVHRFVDRIEERFDELEQEVKEI